MARTADLIASMVLVAVGAVNILGARGLIPGDDPLGPAFLPVVVGTALILLAGTLGIRAMRTGRPNDPSGDEISVGGVGRAIAASLAMAFLFAGLAFVPDIGFPVLATIMVFVLTILFGSRPSVRTLVFSAVLVLATYAVFRLWFKVPLPGPAWFV